MNKIAIISDIHSNIEALEVTLSKIDTLNIDCCVILGDLLTYGLYPNEVIARLKLLQEECKTVFIKGNHDQFYFDIQNNENPFKYNMADFVKESIEWTSKKLNYKLAECFDWKEEFVFNNIYFAHANAFGYSNWKYLNEESTIIETANVLENKGMKVGIFGHTHRPLNDLIAVKEDYCKKVSKSIYTYIDSSVLILNPGSIGQPRGSSASFMLLEVDTNQVKFNKIELDICINNIKSEIQGSNLTQATKNKLCEYWKEIND
jgi:predicted phosphodiesterase